MDKFGRQTGNEWDKLEENVVNVFGDKQHQHAQNPKDDSTDVHEGARMRWGIYAEEMDIFLADHMVKDLFSQMEDYLNTVKNNYWMFGDSGWRNDYRLSNQGVTFNTMIGRWHSNYVL